MRFTSFLSGGFVTAIVVNPPERKLAKCTSVKCGGKRDVIYKRFQYRMDYPFDWIPELKDACDKICNVDVDLKRQKEFSQNLKNVTNCYQKILSDRQSNL